MAADTLKIAIPRHGELTPVRRLNREGVEGVKRQQHERAAAQSISLQSMTLYWRLLLAPQEGVKELLEPTRAFGDKHLQIVSVEG